MKTKKLDFLIYVHVALSLWFVLFVIGLFIPDGGKTASALAIGNVLFLFVNIPLGVFSLISKVKDRFSIDYKKPVAILSIINIVISVAVWLFLIALLQMP